MSPTLAPHTQLAEAPHCTPLPTERGGSFTHCRWQWVIRRARAKRRSGMGVRGRAESSNGILRASASNGPSPQPLSRRERGAKTPASQAKPAPPAPPPTRSGATNTQGLIPSPAQAKDRPAAKGAPLRACPACLAGQVQATGAGRTGGGQCSRYHCPTRGRPEARTSRTDVRSGR